ncbi:single-stranded-DNA-specific exonuclease RecJ, partial [Patescibacteria group bacterium]|nr:single-stranded-DNA-specific exonuclease RecJ [Patescibacteria group bacterium]
ILWECLYVLNKNTLPYIPDRFSEGYGLNAGSVRKLKAKNPKLKVIITVDNGIVAHEAVDVAKKLGIDVIVTDHHQKGKKLPKAHSIIQTDQIAGAGVAWFLAREIQKKLKAKSLKLKAKDLELVAIGSIADLVPLLGTNRSLVKHGLEALNKTKRPGLLALFKNAGLEKESTRLRSGATVRRVGTYEVGYIIAPRINAMGRLEHGIDSLRLLCTRSKPKAQELAKILAETNTRRQEIVEEVVAHAKDLAKDKKWKGVIVLSHETYHEGVIGLAASKLVELYYRPAIVMSRGKKFSKASARSIPGFNIIESIRSLEEMIIGGGGHPMAAGFSIETDKIEMFLKKLDEISLPLLTDDVLARTLKIDLELNFEQVDWELEGKLADFEPTGIGNPKPTFATKKANVVNARTVGAESKHLKLKLEKDDKVFDAIAFGMGDFYTKLLAKKSIDVVYNLEKNVWNGKKSLQLKIKDIKSSSK